MKHIAYFILILTIFASCQDEFSNTELIIPENPNPSILVNSSFIGKIVDIQGNPIADTQVALGGETQFSNELGYFQFDGVQLDRYGSLLTAEKTGYLLGLRRVSVNAGTTNYVEVILLSDSPSYSFNSEESATIEDDSGVSLRFTANSIALESGQVYSGNVNVSIKYINPAAENIAGLLPGCLQGLTTEGSLTTLKSYSMISVELTDDQGQELQIKSGETVEIEFPVDVVLLNNAPTQIPLWSLDEETGLWLEEGMAELVGDEYIGEVSHFSYWNCDIPEDFVFVEGNVCNNVNGACEPLAFSEIQVLDELNEVRLVSQTDSDGNFSVFIPRDAMVTIDFISICDGVDDQKNIGPFTEDQNLGTVEVSAALSQLQFSAEVFNCDGSLLENGTIILNDNIIADVSNGIVNKSITVCDESDITAIALNEDFSEVSQLSKLTYSENINTSLQLCEQEFNEEFIIVNITDQNGNTYKAIFLDSRYQSCGEIITTNFPVDGPETVSSDFVSSLVGGSDFLEEVIDSQEVYIGFDHGMSCQTSSNDVKIQSAFFSILIDNLHWSLGAFNPEVLSNENENTNENGFSEINIVSYGQNLGDIIEGSLQANNLIASRLIEFEDGSKQVNDEERVYSAIISFRVIVKE